MSSSNNFSQFDQTLNQQSAYTPSNSANASLNSGNKLKPGQKRKTVLRSGAGQQWEDTTLLEWDPSHYRLFVGNLSNDVNDQVLSDTFSRYKSFQKARVVRDKISNKAKFGFLSFSDPEDFLKAWREMDGKYVGNRPIKLQKSSSNVKPNEIGWRKSRDLQTGRTKRPKPY